MISLIGAGLYNYIEKNIILTRVFIYGIIGITIGCIPKT
jgi:hypothetical protein